MSITYAVGDATDPAARPAIIAHVVNDVGAFGAGFAAAVARRWPAARTDYLRWYRSDLRLGRILLSDVGDGLRVAHLAAQSGLGRRNKPLRLDALAQCLATLGVVAAELGGTVVMPRIGTGLAGGRWEDVEPLVARLTTPVIVYDLHVGDSRTE